MTESKNLVLVVDDNNINLQVIAEMLESNGYEPIMVNDGWQALDYLRTEKPDIILLDVMMPEIDGFEVCKKIKADPTTADIPVIFITGRSESEDVVSGFEVGGADYITKPFNSVELFARVKTQIALKKMRDQLALNNEKLILSNQIIKEKNSALNNMVNKLEEAVSTDVLTKVFNRRYMNELLQRESSRYIRSKRTFVVMLADIDFFKKINDTYGHDCGDEVLQMVAKEMKICIREHDVLSRWGGEEFLFFLPETNLEGAIVVAERIRQHFAELIIKTSAQAIKLTVTLGLAEYDGEGMDCLLQSADTALYEGKQTGRNKVCVATEKNLTKKP